MTDLELLAEYSKGRSQTAFAELVEKYVRLVHWACWRQLGDTQLAEDATQMVFVLLSQRAGRMRHGEVAGWLLTTAHFTCANMKRSEERRQRREREVGVKQSGAVGGPNAEMLGMLDEGMMRLADVDRAAVALRFFQDQPLRQVGESLGMSEEAARKRVERGVEKLRQFFRERGLQTDSVALAGILADRAGVPAIGEALTKRIVQATGAVPRVAGMSVRPGGIAVATVVVSAILGAVGWEFFKESSKPLVSETVAAAPAGGGAGATTSPVSDAPAADTSTPDNTLTLLCRALQAVDRAGVDACFVSNPNRVKGSLDASLDEDLASRRMILAGTKVYGQDAAKLNEGMVSLETVLQAVIVLRQMQGATAAINGNSATIDVEIPDALMRAVPPGVQGMLREWSGKPIYFELQDGVWRLDADRSIRYTMEVEKRRNGPWAEVSGEEAVAILEEQAKGWDAVTEQISSGKLPRFVDGQRAVRTTINHVNSKFGIYGMRVSEVPVGVGRP